MSNSFVHVACMKWSVAHDNRQTCRGCKVKLRAGEGRIEGETSCFGTRRRPFWHPACFQKGPEHFGSALDIKELRGAPRDQLSSGAVQRRSKPRSICMRNSQSSRVKMSVDFTISSSSEDEPDEPIAVDRQCARSQNCGQEAASAKLSATEEGYAHAQAADSHVLAVGGLPGGAHGISPYSNEEVAGGGREDRVQAAEELRNPNRQSEAIAWAIRARVRGRCGGTIN